MLDNPSELTIVSEKGSFGQLKVNLIPTEEVYSFIIDWNKIYGRYFRG